MQVLMKRIILPLLVACTILTSCDDTTDTIGASLTNPGDMLNVSAETFYASTESVVIDSVLSNSSLGYLGKIKDPETGAYVTSHFMTQFHIIDDYTFPEKANITSKNSEGEIVADSVEVRLFFTTFYGDSLASMKCTLHEMSDYMKEGKVYYSNYSPEKEGLLKDNGLEVTRSYSLADMSINASDRWAGSYRNIHIPLNKEYTKDGKTYSNYGTYIMQKYYENPAYFHNSMTFTHNVCPGFYIESSNGIGSIATIELTQLNVYFSYIEKTKTGKDTIVSGVASFVGTEEVLQKNTIEQNKSELEKLANNKECTYLKTPGGIFTEITMPVDDILKGHENDTLNTAKMTILRETNTTNSDYALSIPQTLLLLPADSMFTFFEKAEVADYRNSYLTSYSSTTNGYTFGNVSGLIRSMYSAKSKYMKEHPSVPDQKYAELFPNWNKAVLIPVNTSYTTISSSNVLTKVTNNMALTSTKLVGGKDNPKAISINVIYSKFQTTE